MQVHYISYDSYGRSDFPIIKVGWTQLQINQIKVVFSLTPLFVRTNVRSFIYLYMYVHIYIFFFVLGNTKNVCTCCFK